MSPIDDMRLSLGALWPEGRSSSSVSQFLPTRFWSACPMAVRWKDCYRGDLSPWLFLQLCLCSVWGRCVLWLFNVSWQIAVAPQFKRHVIDHLLLVIAQNKHEWTSEGILFQLWKDVNAHYYSSSSPPMLLSCLVCLSDKNGRFGIMIAC